MNDAGVDASLNLNCNGGEGDGRWVEEHQVMLPPQHHPTFECILEALNAAHAT